MTAPAKPAIASAKRHGDTVAVLADGDAVMVLSVRQAQWLAARLAEALAERP